MISHVLFLSLASLTHAQGWSYPIESIETPMQNGYQRKDILVIGSNHIHQIWNRYEGESRVGYNVLLPDGSVILPDRMLSNDTWASYVSLSSETDSTAISFWREDYNPAWFSVLGAEGTTVIEPTLYSEEGWSTWPLIDSSPDSLGRIHMVRNLPDGLICYSVLDPGVGEVFRDTIPDSHQQSLIIVDGDRVHIKYNKGWPDDSAMYIQYDLEGNVTVLPVSLVDEEADESNRCSMTLDSNGNAMVFLVENPDDAQPRFLSLYKINRDTGSLLIDRKILYWPSEWTTLKEPVILPRPGAESFYLLWGEGELGGSPHIHYIKFAIIDSDGNFIEEPYIAYDYSDEDPQDLERIAADVNADGDVFVNWSAYFESIDSYYIVLGWFDHNWVSVEGEEFKEVDQSPMTISTSANPFNDIIEISISGGIEQADVSVFDLQGRHIVNLLPDGQGFCLWDGEDSNGNELPAGAYVIRAESGGESSSLQIIKL